MGSGDFTAMNGKEVTYYDGVEHFGSVPFGAPFRL